jgi:hypothetical protein
MNMIFHVHIHIREYEYESNMTENLMFIFANMNIRASLAAHADVAISCIHPVARPVTVLFIQQLANRAHAMHTIQAYESLRRAGVDDLIRVAV